jgi:DNA-binding GntR family transcriptional regulator
MHRNQGATPAGAGTGDRRTRNRDARQVDIAHPQSGAGAAPPALTPLSRVPSLTERVFNQLRDAIVNRELPPRQAIAIEHLAAMLGVSRTPIREALPALQQLGLVEQTENGGFRVAPLDGTYVWQVYAMRGALESLAIDALVPMLSDADLRELREVAFTRTPGQHGGGSRTLGPALGVHDFIRRKCPLGFLNAMMDMLELHRNRLIDLEQTVGGTHSNGLGDEEHRTIVMAFERRDAQAARDLMKQHLDRIGRETAAMTEL